MAATARSFLCCVLLFLIASMAVTAIALRNHPSPSVLEEADDAESRLVSVTDQRQIAPTCLELACPAYDTLHSGAGFEIRKYKASVWVSTAPVVDISFNSATRDGFLRLFDYINGSNLKHQKIAMTAPVLTGVIPSAGPVCASSFIVQFFSTEASSDVDTPVPDPKLNLNIEEWSSKCFAVRTFSGFATDENVPQEAYALLQSLKGTPWADISKTTSTSLTESYIVAQYNSPFEVTGRVNEIWLSIQASKSDCHF